MTHKGLLLIGDADVIIGSVNPTDSNHEKVMALTEEIQQTGAHVVFPVTAISEAITLIQRRLENPTLTQSVIDMVKAKQISLIEVNEAAIAEASAYFNPQGSKQNTFFDALVAAVAKLNFADAIFSFDAWYASAGFTLADTLLAQGSIRS